MVRTRAVAVVLALVLGASCRGRAPEPVRGGDGAGRTGGAAAQAPHRLAPLAKQLYEAAKAAYREGDLAAMAGHLERAVAVQGDFTEAWYNLGACRTNLAQEAAVAYRDVEAVDLFRAAVAAKRQARELMDRGVWYVYLSADEQHQVRSDVEHALEDADSVLEDQAALLAALRLTAR
jgi:hypothetical protein